MAVKEVRLNGTTIMSVADTTATESDVAYGKVFYKSNGNRAVGENQGGASVTSGFKIENNDNLFYSEFLNWDDEYGSSYMLRYDTEYKGMELAINYQNCVTIGSKNRSYDLQVGYYNNSQRETTQWVNANIPVETYKLRLKVNEGGKSTVKTFYANATVTYLDYQDNQLTKQQLLSDYANEMFRLNSFIATKYTQQEAEQFIIDNDVDYSKEEERLAIVAEIMENLAKTENIVFRQNAPTHEHTYSLISSTSPTCAHEGTNTLECTICHEKTTQTTPALAHTYGEWEVISAATEEKEGLRQRTCSVCGFIDQEEIPIIGKE